MKKNNTYKNIIPAFIFFTLLFIIIGLSNKNTNVTSQSGWTLQTNLQSQLRGRTISDMTFTDSVTGYAVTPWVNTGDSTFIFKTTNGGDNWFAIVSQPKALGGFNKIKFINNNTGFTCGDYFKKTTNAGFNWNIVLSWNSFGLNAENMFILNEDTIYLTNSNGLNGGIFRTTNGGENWQRTWFAGIYNPLEIYMYNARIGFYAQGDLWKTTDGGFNWTIINNRGFVDIKFFDSLTGYKTYADSTGYGRVQKTTNGGFNWVIQQIPNIPNADYTLKSIERICFVGSDTILGVGSTVQYINPLRTRGIIYKTTNGGLNWGYQVPDTHLIQISRYNLISFAGNKHGWIYNGYYTGGKGMGIHTTIGGDTTFYTEIKNQTINITSDFILYQNYPNPFNPKTIISYKVESTKQIKLIVFDILGKEITTLVSQKQKAGEYEVKFDGTNLSSGIYFYSLFIDGKRAITKKMMLIK